MKKYLMFMFGLVFAVSLVSCGETPDKNGYAIKQPRLSNAYEEGTNKKGANDKNQNPEYGNEEGSEGSEVNKQPFSFKAGDVVKLQDAGKLEGDKYKVSFKNITTDSTTTIEVQAAGSRKDLADFVDTNGSLLCSVDGNDVYVYINTRYSHEEVYRSIGLFFGKNITSDRSPERIFIGNLKDNIGVEFKVKKNTTVDGVIRDYSFSKVA
jgi:hypothetical protein